MDKALKGTAYALAVAAIALAVVGFSLLLTPDAPERGHGGHSLIERAHG